METNKIKFLCSLSDKLNGNAERVQDKCFIENIKSIEIKSDYRSVIIDFDNYPELKPVAEKLCDYLIKSEKEKQKQIKLDIINLLGQ